MKMASPETGRNLRQRPAIGQPLPPRRIGIQFKRACPEQAAWLAARASRQLHAARFGASHSSQRSRQDGRGGGRMACVARVSDPRADQARRVWCFAVDSRHQGVQEKRKRRKKTRQTQEKTKQTQEKPGKRDCVLPFFFFFVKPMSFLCLVRGSGGSLSPQALSAFAPLSPLSPLTVLHHRRQISRFQRRSMAV